MTTTDLDRRACEAATCRCGCGGSSTHRVWSEDLDGRFVEDCCGEARSYMEKCAAEAGFPFQSQRLTVAKAAARLKGEADDS